MSLDVNIGNCALVRSIGLITNLLIRALKRTFILFGSVTGLAKSSFRIALTF
jgi:hypothetical protein